MDENAVTRQEFDELSERFETFAKLMFANMATLNRHLVDVKAGKVLGTAFSMQAPRAAVPKPKIKLSEKQAERRQRDGR